MKILLVKLSSLGDVVHTLPVVQDIRAAMPDAQIDWVLEKSFVLLLAPLAEHGALRRIIPCELRRWRKAPFSAATRREWRRFKSELQSEAYDAVIDLQGLGKSALIAWLARLAPGGKRYAMANQTDGSGYEAPTRWVADIAIRMEPHTHAVQRARELAAKALVYRPLSIVNFGLKEVFGTKARAESATKNIASEIPSKTVAFVHGTSRVDKEWPLDHWIALGQRLLAAGFKVALLHGNAKEEATSQAIAAGLGNTPALWRLLQLDELTAALAQCTGVVGVDSGVSHIAVALGLPHVQIYNFDTAWRTGPRASDAAFQISVFAKPAPSVDAVWQAWQACGPQPS